jgi:hypothetical protein
MMFTEIGKNRWSFSGGNIPLKSTGTEPEFVSQDKISILNTTGEDAKLKLTLYFLDDEPAGEYKIKVKSERVRKFRVNDLIDPHAIPLGVPYGCVVESDVPVVVQFTRQNTSRDQLAIMGTLAYYSNDHI